MNIHSKLEKIYSLPKFEDLPPYWKNYFLENDRVIEENFWGNLALLKNAEQHNDPYIQQLKEMGYCFVAGAECPAPFYQALSWVFKRINKLIEEKNLTMSDVLWPARVFEIDNNHGEKEYVVTVIGEEPPRISQEMNLVTPDVFVSMLGKGFFPIGSSIREHTNQSLAEHDLAHFGGFISSPEYMRMVRKGFGTVSEKMKSNPQIRSALEHFDSVYSLRLYYMTEIFTLTPETQKKRLQDLVEIDIKLPVHINSIITLLEEKAKNPASLYQYLYTIYNQFYELVDPVGGESRDILNRVRKFNRSNRLGIFFSQESNLDSKFDGSSIYSMYQNGCAALENKRSTHPDFLTALREIHAPFIGTLIGTSQLTVEDWVMQAVEEIPDPNSKLYQYLCNSGMWNEAHLIYWAYGCDDFTKILSNVSYG